MDITHLAYGCTVLLCFIVSLFVWLFCLRGRKRKFSSVSLHNLLQPQRQQDEIYNISGRVQGQNSEQRLPSDAYLTVEHITASNQLNKPSYNDEPPSYEEAIKLASHLPPPPVLPPVYTGIYDRPSVHVTSPVSPTVTIAIS
ncbi:unnamed protein product [Brassicogethes aeneus]|uniref:Uncharacterized protein n=1 Tax=Brassicogethes aeneus TaxID=1431903 RepID=A0A9P0B1Q4_BRAAE|nr:unnamed protein product [Brassicogethes aeneus]